MGGNLVNKEKAEGAASDILNGKDLIFVYFSAHWCPPCRGFTPVMAKKYEEHTKDGTSNIEVVFVSSDRDQGAFDGYLAEMPWYAVPWADREKKGKLGEQFNVTGIPCLSCSRETELSSQMEDEHWS